MKNKYDSSVAFLYATGKEHLLPEDFRKKIPYTTIFNWRNMGYSDYLGYEFRCFFDDVEKVALIHKENENLKKTLTGIKKSWVILSPYLLNLIKNAKKDKALQKNVIESIFILKKRMGLENTLKIFNLSKTLYHEWLLEARANCNDSFISLCVKRHPHQLQLKEVRKIEKMLKDPELDHWPIVSIASHGYRSGEVVASLHTWYKYARLLEITKKAEKKFKKHSGLKASCPNEFLHADTTYYPMNDEQMVSITFVMDNYSTMILGYNISMKANFESVSAALTKAMDTIMFHPDQSNKIQEEQHSFLVTDGGGENHSNKLNEFITKLSGYRITKIRALKDIRFSNSPVEAIHKTMKGRYLRKRTFETWEGFLKFIAWAVRDYNEKRPHSKHKPLTPKEVYFGNKIVFNHENKIKNARKVRIKNNKCSKCNECQCIETSIAC